MDEVRKANRKAMPAFILIVAVSAIVGGGIGFLSAKYGVNTLASGIKAAGAFFGARMAPWLMLAAAIIVPVVCVPIYRSTKKRLAAWDGEDEEASDTVGKKLSVILWVTSAVLILSFFLIAASFSGGFAAFDKEENALPFFVGIASFTGIMIETVMIQQRCVDTVKKMNPEKTASVYDMKFQKKWLDS